MVKISELNPTQFPRLGHAFPASYEGETVKLTIEQVRALLAYVGAELPLSVDDPTTITQALIALGTEKADTSYVDEQDNSIVVTLTNQLGLYIAKAGDSGLGGFSNILHVLGPSAGQTFVIDLSVSNYKQIANTGAFTLSPPSTSTELNTMFLIDVWPAGGEGSMTAVGFNVPVEGVFNPAKRQLLQIICISYVRKLMITDGS